MDTALSDSGLFLPAGAAAPSGLERGTIVNETDLPDGVVREAVETYFEENAGVFGVSNSASFGMYQQQSGSLLARSKYQMPNSVIEEIMLARDLAERDDDVGATIGSMLAAAYDGGMQHEHEDEVTIGLFNKVARAANIDHVLLEMYRELLIAGQVTTAMVFTREAVQFTPSGADRQRTRQLVTPLIGVLPSELIRVVGNDLFGTATLGYKPATATQEAWLGEFFSKHTSPAKKAEMRRQDPVLTRLLLEELPVEDNELVMLGEGDDVCVGSKLYRLNPRLTHRSYLPKGAWKYPRPLLTRNFALLEAKRLLNIMDYALLQGGSNFLVVAKKGSEKQPATSGEVLNLRETLKRATRTGVIIGDHRLDIEIITPDLESLLNPAKRRLLGKKIAQGLLRIPDISDAEAGAGKSVEADLELLQRVIGLDRRMLKRHMENQAYEEVVNRNPGQFPKGAPSIWHPRIVLQGLQWFTDMMLKLNDRGAISRKTLVEAGGMSYEHEKAQRKREKSHGDDRLMTPPESALPGGPGGSSGPQDNNDGRPRGTSPGNGHNAPRQQPQGKPTRVIRRVRGETVRGLDHGGDRIVKVGEQTLAVLESYADTKADGRLTQHERSALTRLQSESWPEEPMLEGPLAVVGVNPDYAVDQVHAVRLDTGLSMLVGVRDDGAIVARALCFRTPRYDAAEAEALAQRFGFLTANLEGDDDGT